MPNVREQVVIYRQRGWYCVPLRPRSKKPVCNDWPNVRIEVDDIKTHFSAKDNVGLILGKPSGWLIDVDLDCHEAIELADSYRLQPNQLKATASQTHNRSVTKTSRNVTARD